jgi:exopolysaccharide biosynthesis polyprenyl glycosylphosphotransferase
MEATSVTQAHAGPEAVTLRPGGAASLARAGSGPASAARFLLEGRGLTPLRILLDTAMLALATAVALDAVTKGAPPAQHALWWLFPPLALLMFAHAGLYGRAARVDGLDGLLSTVKGTGLGAVAVVALAGVIGTELRTGVLLAEVWALGTAAVLAGRLPIALARRRGHSNGDLGGKPTLIVGAGRIGVQVERRLRERPDLGLRPVGFLDGAPLPDDGPPSTHTPVLGSPFQLERTVVETGARHVIVAFSSEPDSIIAAQLRRCAELGVEVYVIPRLYENLNGRAALEHLGELSLLSLRRTDPKGWQFATKHAFDRIAAMLFLVLLAPALLAIALAVKLSVGGPVLFRQRRVGRDGREFGMFKFRTMRGSPETHGEADEDWAAEILGQRNGNSAPVAERRTRAGRFLRRWSLDELPQLFNVLAGQMSLVGPRPERVRYVTRFESRIDRYGDRHRVKSGITGWAQVNGLRGRSSLTDRVEADNFYIENWSWRLDLKILLLTFGALLRPCADAPPVVDAARATLVH